MSLINNNNLEFVPKLSYRLSHEESLSEEAELTNSDEQTHPKEYTLSYRKVRTIAERLECNRQYALTQQRKEGPKKFSLHIRIKHWAEEYTQTLSYKVRDHLVGVSYCIGERPRMEDRHIETPISIKLSGTLSETEYSLFGIFDGHNGSKASRNL